MEDIRNQFLKCLYSQINVSGDSTKIEEAIESGLSVEDYIRNKFTGIMQEWQKENPLLPMPNFMISMQVGDTIYDIALNGSTSNLSDSSLFDIASMTKLYTEVLLFRIINSNREYIGLLDKKLSEFPDFFEKYTGNITDLKVRDLIEFNATLTTQDDLRPNAPNFKQDINTIKVLRATNENKDMHGYYLYSDIGIMILTDFLEHITSKSYEELIKEYILEPLGLDNTFITLPDSEKVRYVASDVNRESGGVNDPKRNALASGHAGIKTTSHDYVNFLDAIFSPGFIFKDDFDPLLFEFLSTSDTRYESYYINGTKAYYKIEDGDTLESISEKFGISKSDIESENQGIEIKKGNKITLPFYYVLGPNETLEDVAKKFNLSMEEITKENPVLESGRIKIPISNSNTRARFHLRVFGIGKIGNFNIGTPDVQVGEKRSGTLASNSISSKGLSVQGSTRVHGETSIYKLWKEDDQGLEFNVGVNTAFTILTDVYAQGVQATYSVNGENYSTYDVRGVLPYKYFKRLIDAVADGRTIALYERYCLEQDKIISDEKTM